MTEQLQSWVIVYLYVEQTSWPLSLYFDFAVWLHFSFFFFFIFFFQLLLSGVATADHLPPSCPTPSILFCTKSLHDLLHYIINALCGLPLFLLPRSSIFNILCPLYPESLLWTCTNHLNLASLTLLLNHLTWGVPLIFSLLSVLISDPPGHSR